MITRRSWFLILCGVFCLVWAFSAKFFPSLIQFEGAGAFSWILMVLTLWLSVWRISSRFLPRDGFLMQFVVSGFLFQVFASAIIAWLGLATIMNLQNVCLVLAAIAIGVSQLRPSPKDELELSKSIFPSQFDRALTIGGIFFGFSAWTVYTFNDLRYTTIDADNMWYHLPMVAVWMQTGSIWPSDVISQIARAYPGYREAIQVFLSLPLHNEHLANPGGLELLLFGVVVYLLARRWTHSIALSALAGVYAVTIPFLGSFSGIKGNDQTLGLNVALLILFLDLYFRRGGSFWAILAGLAFGALSSTKLSGPFYAGIILGTFIVIRWIWRSSPLRSLGVASWMLMGLTALIVAGPWYLRNCVFYHNPVWPAKMSIGSWVLFNGPFSKEQRDATTMGWNIQPLLDHANYFLQAFGPMVAIIGFSFVGLTILSLIASKWKQPRELLPLILWPILFFVFFLHQPYNQPSFEYCYNMRYLMPWFVVCLLALISLVGQSRWSSQMTALLLFVGAIWNFSQISKYYLPAICLALLISMVSLKIDLLEKCRFLARNHIGKLKPIIIIVFIGSVFWAADFRDKMQYAADYGYRDPSSRSGWGQLCSYVHRDVTDKKILVVGDDLFFPLFGDKLSNMIFWSGKASSVKELFDDCVVYDIDYVVAFPQRMERKDANNFTFAKPIIPELIQKFPGRFEVVKQFGPTYLVRVIR